MFPLSSPFLNPFLISFLKVEKEETKQKVDLFLSSLEAMAKNKNKMILVKSTPTITALADIFPEQAEEEEAGLLVPSKIIQVPSKISRSLP